MDGMSAGEMLTEVPKLSFPKVDERKPPPRIPPLVIAKDDIDAVKRSGNPGELLLPTSALKPVGGSVMRDRQPRIFVRISLSKA